VSMMETLAEIVVILSSIAFSVAVAGVAISALFGAVHHDVNRDLSTPDAPVSRPAIPGQ
jgi:hypothetical protein